MPIIVIIIIIYYLLLDAYSLCTILHSRHFSWFALFWENLKTWDAIHEQRSTKVVYSIQEPLSLFTYLRKQLLKKNVLYRNVMTVAIENNSPFTCQFTERRSTCLGHNMMVVSKEFAYSRNTLDYAQFIKRMQRTQSLLRYFVADLLSVVRWRLDDAFFVYCISCRMWYNVVVPYLLWPATQNRIPTLGRYLPSPITHFQCFSILSQSSQLYYSIKYVVVKTLTERKQPITISKGSAVKEIGTRNCSFLLIFFS